MAHPVDFMAACQGLKTELTHCGMVLVRNTFVMDSQEEVKDGDGVGVPIEVSVRSNDGEWLASLKLVGKWPLLGVTFIVKLKPGDNFFHIVRKDGVILQNYCYKYAAYRGKSKEDMCVVVPVLATLKDQVEEGKDGSGEKNKNLDVSNKIRLAMGLMQGFFAEKTGEHNPLSSETTFSLQDGIVDLSLDWTKEELAEMSAEQVWAEVEEKLKNASIQLEGLNKTNSKPVWAPNKKFVIFMLGSCKLPEVGSSSGRKLACAGGNIAVVGFDTYDVWPGATFDFQGCLNDLNPLSGNLLDVANLMGCQNKTRGSLYQASMGALAHEMGHLFDLGHTEQGLMGDEYWRFGEYFEHIQERLFCMECRGMAVTGPKSKKPGACLTHNHATLLVNHKWFGHQRTRSSVGIIGITLDGNKLKSQAVLKAVEIRDVETGLVLNELELKAGTKEMNLVNKHLPYTAMEKAVLVAVNAQGDIFKGVVERKSLPNSYSVFPRRHTK